MKKLLIIGAGGHERCCLDIARDMDIFDKISFFDDNHIDETINDYKVIVSIAEMNAFYLEYENIFIAVGNYMREMHIKAHYIKPWTRTTISKDFSKRLKNILKRDFDPSSPDAAWCTDITYIWTYDDGFVYLTSVMDLFSRKIVSWVLTKDMTAESVLEAIKIAQERRNNEKSVIIHSDRGIQFTSE